MKQKKENAKAKQEALSKLFDNVTYVVTPDPTNSTVADIRFTVPVEVVNSVHGDMVSKYRGTDHKGFRKGQMPETLLFNIHGKAIQSNVTGELMANAYQKFQAKEKPYIIFEKRKEKEDDLFFHAEKGKEFSFTLIVEYYPVFEVKGYDDVILEKAGSVPDEEVTAVINNFLKAEGDIVEKTQNENVVEEFNKVTFEITDKDNKVSNKQIIAVKHTNPCYIGMKLDDGVMVGTTKLKIIKINELVPLEPTDENIRKITQEENLENLKTTLKAELLNKKREEIAEVNKEKIMLNILSQTGEFNLPPIFVEQEINGLTANAKLKEPTDEIRKTAVERIRKTLILKKLEEILKIKITQADLDNYRKNFEMVNNKLEKDTIDKFFNENYSYVAIEISNFKVQKKLLELNAKN